MAEFGQFILRKATNRDVESVWSLISSILASYGIRADCQTTDRDLLDLNASYWDQGGSFYVLLDGPRVIGTVAVRPDSATVCELCRMYLAVEFRGRGLGRRLLGHAFGLARNHGYNEMLLKTASTLKEAISLYERAGFRRDVGTTACGNCNLVMRKALA